MMTPRRRDGEPNGDIESAPLIEITAGRRHVPVTLKSIAVIVGVMMGVGSCVAYLGSHIMWPWSRQDAAIVHLQAVVDTVQREHHHTRSDIGLMREDISTMKNDAALTSQAICAMTRKFAPENTPPGCTPIPPSDNRERR